MVSTASGHQAIRNVTSPPTCIIKMSQLLGIVHPVPTQGTDRSWKRQRQTPRNLKPLPLRQEVVISLIFVSSFIILYTIFGACLILQGLGLWKRKSPSSSITVTNHYDKLGEPPLR